jgi:predicted RNA-binding Zn-ribbon protein involved in translation (DUF1610 family)
MSSYDSYLAREQERHDHPACEHCGQPTWRGDLDSRGYCPTCGDMLTEDVA